MKQFEELRDGSVALVLDFWMPESPTRNQQMNAEIAASMLTTAIQQTMSAGNGRLVVSLAAEEIREFSDNVSFELRDEMFQLLAILQPSKEPAIASAIERISGEIEPQMNIVVISTRPESDAISIDLRSNTQFHWVDTSSESIDQIFTID